MSVSLSGLRVLITRALEQAGEFSEALRAAGAEPVVIPMIRFAAPRDWEPVDTALAHLEDYDALLLTSQNGLRCFLARARVGGVDVQRRLRSVFCVGPATAAYAAREGFAVEELPERSFDAEGMLAQLKSHGNVPKQCFLMPRAERGRNVLPEGLQRAGVRVDVVTVYRTEPVRECGEALCRMLEAGELDALTFTSPSTVAAFSALLSDRARTAASSTAMVAIGAVTDKALREHGFTPQEVAHSPGAKGLVQALERLAERKQRVHPEENGRA